jgi:hypothetical protein
MKKFWAPIRREQLRCSVEDGYGAGLLEIVMLPIRSHRDALRPARL